MTQTEALAAGVRTHPHGLQPSEGRPPHADASGQDQGARTEASTPGARPDWAHTHGCGAWWTGNRTAHCGGSKCHRTFSSMTAFDRHQRSRTEGGVECLDPASVGLVAAEKPYGTLWACPSNGGGNPHAKDGDHA
jgi:hypothetical protein